jgi:Pentapeptide repeats (8 copies)
LAISEADEYILNSIPINITQGHITFIHKSIQEFFISQSCILWITKIQLPSSHSGFSQEGGILNFLSQQIHLPTHSKLLLNQVLSSRSNKEVRIASSNALTILNACRFSFSMLDLSSIHAGVDLSNAIMEATNLSHSNLEGALMCQCWLKSANLQLKPDKHSTG